MPNERPQIMDHRLYNHDEKLKQGDDVCSCPHASFLDRVSVNGVVWGGISIAGTYPVGSACLLSSHSELPSHLNKGLVVSSLSSFVGVPCVSMQIPKDDDEFSSYHYEARLQRDAEV
jgi:hypothetical protein